METGHWEPGTEETALAYEALIARITAWAAAREDIRAVLVIGSRARQDRPADQWSDLDVAIVARNPRPYLASADWLDEIGEVAITFLEPTATGEGTERRVLFRHGLDVDFAFDAQEQIERMIAHGLPPLEAKIFQRGVRLLLDRDGLAAKVLAAAGPPERYRPPTQAEFLNLVHDFWYHTVWTAKKLRRGELWTAKSCCDSYMKHLLLRMVEWHAHGGEDVDTWHNGRFLEQWASQRAVQELGSAFAHYDAADICRALWATMDLFRWLAVETAGKLGYAYPITADKSATALVEMLAPRAATQG